MPNRSAESIAKEIADVVLIKSKLINEAKEIVFNEIDKHDALKHVLDEEKGLAIISGIEYGQATLDLNYWFTKVKTTFSAESIARDMMEDIHGQLVPGNEHTL